MDNDYYNQHLSGIYKIECQSTGKIYIGKSNNLGRRFSGHLFHLLIGDHSNKPLQADFNKFGCQDFSFKVVEMSDKDTLSAREAWWMAQYDKQVLYNIITVYDQSKFVDIKTFTEFINSKWLMPNGFNPKMASRYRIVDTADQEEIVDVAHKCKLFNLCRSKTTFLRVIKMMSSDLGYTISTSRTSACDGHRTYKLITAFDSNKITYVSDSDSCAA